MIILRRQVKLIKSLRPADRKEAHIGGEKRILKNIKNAWIVHKIYTNKLFWADDTKDVK